MKKNIWIINHYATGMMINHGGRHYWFAKYLKRKGYEPVVFCCNAKHGIKERWIESKEHYIEKAADDIDVKFVVVNARLYEDNGKDRILNMISFYHNVQIAAKNYAEKYGNPDIIYASSVHPLTLIAGIKLAKYFNVKCISEIRDLWPESIFAYSKKLNKNSVIGKMLYRGEYWIYKKSDALIFTMEGGRDYIIEHKWDMRQGGLIDTNNVFHVNNGVDLEIFDKCATEHNYVDADLDDTSVFKVVYAGSIRKVNKIDVLLDTAKKLESFPIRFVIFGRGDELERLEKRVRNERIKNVVFKGFVEKRFIPSIDRRADLNIVHWEASPLIKYGDSSNKSFEYFAAGKPVLYTTNPGYSVVKQFQCGVVTENQEPNAIAEAIITIMKMGESEKAIMCENARKAAICYDFKNLTNDLVKIIEKM